MTFIAALRCDAITAPCAFDQYINGQNFFAWVQRFLIPALKPGDIVILHNLQSYKGKAVREAIRVAGARLLFLTAYNPDLTRSNSLGQAKAPPPRGRQTKPRDNLAWDRQTPEPVLARRVPLLSCQFRAPVIIKSSCSRLNEIPRCHHKRTPLAANRDLVMEGALRWWYALSHHTAFFRVCSNHKSFRRPRDTKAMEYKSAHPP